MLVDGTAPVVLLPAAGAVLHVDRVDVGPARIQALHRARSALAANRIPVVELMRSRSESTWHECHGRVVEVERWVEHDGRMNTWSRLRTGAALLADVHNAGSGLDLGPDGEVCTWANWISPAEVVAHSESAGPRLRRWGLGALAEDVVRLAELTADDPSLPTQIVHGDFWDNNVYLRDEQIIAVTDFEFLGRRPRVDDLALLLYFADEQPYFDGAGRRSPQDRRDELTPLVRAYAHQLTTPLSDEEITALPLSLARQPLWNYGTRFLTDTDEDHARQDAISNAAAVARALEVMTEPDRWAEAFGAT